MNIKPDVVNLHFVDYCNYRCCYCFVKKENITTSFLNIKLIVDNLKKYFSSIGVCGRINLVGGEIFMCNYLQEIIDYIWYKGIKVSIVTNGSLLTKDFIESNRNKIDSIGISVDSLEYDTNIRIGRCSKDKTLSKEDLIEICNSIKANHIRLKINHCLSKYNEMEDISILIKTILPDRFKIFQMSIVEGINDKSKNMQLTQEEFKNACKKYVDCNPIIEETSEMKSSYLMIDSKGDFYIDRSDAPIGNVINEDFIALMEKGELDSASFAKRYIPLHN